MKSLSNDVRFLALATVLVALLGVQTLADLAREDVVERSAVAAAIGPRSPASVAKIIEKPAALAWSEPLVDWSCEQRESKPFAVQGRHLQLRGKACSSDFKAERVSIVNETNGFTASVFEKTKANFETDLIQLREGQNRLRLIYQLSPNRQIETIFDVTSSAN